MTPGEVIGGEGRRDGTGGGDGGWETGGMSGGGWGLVGGALGSWSAKRRGEEDACPDVTGIPAQAERCYLPWVRKAQGLHHGRKVLLREQGRCRGLSRRQVSLLHPVP
ncbi:hypothetical protein E2C01_035543 [Portunus trituberculatus]|uniref:Uncharacterized protein n=1 Tax=Portunus trituberculatus TaxID=210409 RepID=A0A5B7F649_PORTR|nr:hypothetical protein [Portunus trituberculatus]